MFEGVIRHTTGTAGGTVTPILVDIDADDRYRTIQRGFANIDYRDGLEAAAPATSDWVNLDVTFLPEDYTVPAGHRSGMILQASNTVWAVPGTPMGFAEVALGPFEGVTETGSRLHLPLVGASERIYWVAGVVLADRAGGAAACSCPPGQPPAAPPRVAAPSLPVAERPSR